MKGVCKRKRRRQRLKCEKRYKEKHRICFVKSGGFSLMSFLIFFQQIFYLFQRFIIFFNS